MKQFSLSLKIYLVLSITIATSIIIGVMGISGISNVKKKLDFVNDKTVPRLVNALSAQSGFRRLATAQYRMIVSDDHNEEKEIAEDLLSYKKNLDESFASGIALASEARLPLWKKAEADYIAWWEVSLNIQKLTLEEKDKEAFEIAKKQRQLRIDAEKIFDELVVSNREGSKKDQLEADSDFNQLRVFLISIVFCGIVFSAFLAWVVMRSLMKTLNNTVNVIQESTNQVAAASTQIASASQQLAQATTEQASSLEQTASSLEEINSMISKSTENAQTASGSSAQSHKKAEEGRQAVEQMLTSMEEISQSNDDILGQIHDSNRQMSDIVKVIQEIGQRTKVINEIVFQTKLLSFNASVEAARAGEHGKGFAVVAEEVGNLAQMSGNAAKEITSMLDSSISKVEGIVRDTQHKVEALVKNGKAKVDSGVHVAKQCSEMLTEIVQNVSLVAGISQDISQATKEQAQGVYEINKAMTELDTVTQRNASTSEEAACAAEELSAQAESLKGSVNELIAVINGSGAVDHHQAQPKAPSNRNLMSSPRTPHKKTTNNLVSFKSTKPKSARPGGEQFKMASAGDFVPDRNDEGFKE